MHSRSTRVQLERDGIAAAHHLFTQLKNHRISTHPVK